MRMRLPISRWFSLACMAALLFSILSPARAAFAQDQAPAAPIVDDEGGPVSVVGEVNYTYPFFTDGVASPMIILEDQAGFVDRNEHFLFPTESQTIGQITSDFYESPFSYSIALPAEPKGSLRDVDQDGDEDPGVMTFAIAYWQNTWGDPFLDERDMMGGGWSTAYASTRVSEDWETRREYTGGKLLIYAPEEGQGYPSGFGEDGKLFTADDPIVTVPQGYTVVDMDTDPFTFSRPHEAVIDTTEPEGSALADYSGEGYADAFNSLVDKLKTDYAFTEFKGIDWEALRAEYLPRFEEAEADGDNAAYQRALRDFSWQIPDGHINAGVSLQAEFQEAIGGGLGLNIRDTDDGRILVTYLTGGGPAEEEGIELGAEVSEINGMPATDWVDQAVPWSGPFSTEHFKRLQQLRYAVRAPLGTEFEITYRNPGDDDTTTTTLETASESDSFSNASFYRGLTGTELPVEYHPIEGTPYMYARIVGFDDNSVLTIQLWERLMQTLNSQGVPGLVLDMRQNGGGFGFFADQMAAYFFDDQLKLGNSGYYDKSLDEFKFDPRLEDQMYPPDSDLRYHGKVAVLVGPACASACEFFTYDMTLQDRAAIVGQYPSAGLGGGVEDIAMPDGIMFRATVGRNVDADGNIHIEGQGVVPTVQVPVDEETLLSDGDPVVDAAVAWLDGATNVEAEDGGEIAIGDSVEGEFAPDSRTRYTLDVSEGDIVDITLTPASKKVDTILRLYDLDGNLLLEQDDAEDGGSNAEIVDLEIPADLTLVVEAAAAGDTGEGAYTLSVSLSD